MGACIGSIAGSCLASCACTACTSLCGCSCLSSPRGATYMYILIQFTATIAALSLRYSGVDLNVGYDIGMENNPPSLCNVNNTDSLCDDISYDICNSETCEGYWAVYRISFTLAGFFFVMMVLTACTSKAAVYAHQGFWFLKIFFIGALMTAFLFAPNNVLAYYAWIARFIAPLFLIYQAICYIDFGYTINAKLIEKDDNDEDFFCCFNPNGNKWKILMLVISLGLIIASLVCIGLMYHFFPASCAFNALACTTTLIFGLINTAVSISTIAPHATIFVSALIFMYSTYLCYASVSAMPEPSCNAMISGDADTELGWMILSCIIAAFVIAYFSFRMGSKARLGHPMGGNAMTGKDSQSKEGEGADVVTVKVDGANSGDKEEVETVEPDNFLAYHFVMFIVAVYMGMMLTDWGSPAAAKTQKYNLGFASAWLQMAVNWIVHILYFWTMIAAKVCPNRDFS